MSYKPRITEKDRERFVIMANMEIQLRAKGYSNIAGVDEAGRGPLAGPVVAAACVLDPEQEIYGLNDSKKIGEKRRYWLAEEIKDKAISYAIAVVSPKTIDEVNVLEASKIAMTNSLHSLSKRPDIALIDAVYLPELEIPQKAVIKGDATANCIAAASILAKTSRDQIMAAYDKQYPGYGFISNKGYGTAQHYEALEELGLTEIHRLSFLKKLRAGNSVSHSSNTGKSAENFVADHLRDQGYQIIEQNFHLRPFGEIDLIAIKNKRMYIFEVKARSVSSFSNEFLSESITTEKISKLRLVSSYYAQSRSCEDIPIILVGAYCLLNDKNEVTSIKYLEI